MKPKRTWYIKQAPVRPTSDLVAALLADILDIIEGDTPTIHLDRDGLTACGAPSMGAFVTDHENKATCPDCCVLSPFFSKIPKGRN